MQLSCAFLAAFCICRSGTCSELLALRSLQTFFMLTFYTPFGHNSNLLAGADPQITCDSFIEIHAYPAFRRREGGETRRGAKRAAPSTLCSSFVRGIFTICAFYYHLIRLLSCHVPVERAGRRRQHCVRPSYIVLPLSPSSLPCSILTPPQAFCTLCMHLLTDNFCR